MSHMRYGDARHGVKSMEESLGIQDPPSIQKSLDMQESLNNRNHQIHMETNKIGLWLLERRIYVAKPRRVVIVSIIMARS